MPQDDSNPRIVVTGTSTVTSAGLDVACLVKSLDDGTRYLKLRDGDPIAEIEDFDAKRFVRPRKAIKVMCREIQTAFAASMMSAEQSGVLSPECELSEHVDPNRLATVFGSEMLYHPADLAEAARVGIEAAAETDEPIDLQVFGKEGLRKVTPLWLLKHLPNMPACHVGISLGALGPNNTLVTGDISGVDALAEAISCMTRGAADVAVVAAAGTRINETRFTYRCDSPQPKNDRPIEQIGLPGDPTSTGVILGEGSVAMIVETAESAQRRDATEQAEILSIAQRFIPSEALAMPHRSAALDSKFARGNRRSIEVAIAAVLEDAGNPSIDFLISHQNGDSLADKEEAAARAMFASLADAKVIHPIRAIGHTGAASGLMGIAIAVSKLSQFAGQAPRHALAICHTVEGGATAVLIRSV